LLDLRGNIPPSSRLRTRISDVSQLDHLTGAGAFYILDSGYFISASVSVHFGRSLLRHPRTPEYAYRRRYSTPWTRPPVCARIKRHPHRCGLFHRLPHALRRVSFRERSAQSFVGFPYNNFLLPSLTVAQLYKALQVELFFKWIKQHLRIKAFFGRSPTPSKPRLDALSVYLLWRSSKSNCPDSALHN